MQSNALFACSLCSHAEQCATKQRIALWSTRLPPRKGTLPTVAGKKKTSKMLVFFLPCYHYPKIFKSKNAFLFRDLFRDLFFPLFLDPFFFKFFRQVLQRPGLQCLLQWRMALRHHRSP